MRVKEEQRLLLCTDNRGLGVGIVGGSQIGSGVSELRPQKKRLKGYGPQSKADLVWKAVEGVQRGVSHKMIRLCHRRRPPFALFVSVLMSTISYWEMGTKNQGRKILTERQTPTNPPRR